MQETTFVDVKLTRVMANRVYEMMHFDPQSLTPVRNDPDTLLSDVECNNINHYVINLKREYPGVSHDIYLCWSKELERLIGWPLEDMENIRKSEELARYNLIQCEVELEKELDIKVELSKNVRIANGKIRNAKLMSRWKIFIKLITGQFNTIFD